MAKRKSRTQRVKSGALDIVRKARDAARNALQSLRREIDATRGRLDALLAEERQFRQDLFGGSGGSGPGRRAARKAAAPAKPKRRRRRGPARPKTPPVADRYFEKLPGKFTLDDIRKLAGKRAPISLAQWSRAKRIRKTGAGYQKTGS
jgi:hypothetical protein